MIQMAEENNIIDEKKRKRKLNLVMNERRHKEKINNNPLKKETQAKILMLLKNGNTLPYIRKKFALFKDNIYLKELIDKYNNKKIDVNSNGDLFVPPSGTPPPVPVSTTKKYVDNDDNDSDNSVADKLNEKDNKKMLNENVNAVNIKSKIENKTESLNINNAYNNVDKNDSVDDKGSEEPEYNIENINMVDEILNKYPNILLVHNILIRLNLSPPQIKTITLKYMSSSYSCDKNPEILFPTMIAMGVSQPKANLIINNIKFALFGTADDYTLLNSATQNSNTVNNPNNQNNRSTFMVNYDKVANGYAPNNQPPVPIDPEELEQRQQSKFYRKRMNEMIAQAMETTTMMKIINASNTPPTPVTPVGSIIRQTPLVKDGAVVKDEYGNIVYITETVPVNSNLQIPPAENQEIKEMKEAIIALANKIKNNKTPVTKNDDALTNTIISYFKDVANKSIDEKKAMEDRYYRLSTLLSENKREVETKLKSLEQNSDPVSTIKYFNDIKKVIGGSDGNPANISVQLEIEKLKAQSLLETEKKRLDFERWKEEQRRKK